jgi:hypothetical protein
MLPFSDGLPERCFPVVNVAVIAANFAVWPQPEPRRLPPTPFGAR